MEHQCIDSRVSCLLSVCPSGGCPLPYVSTFEELRTSGKLFVCKVEVASDHCD